MAENKTSPRVALVYDRVAAQGGAERVLVALHQAFPEAPLYTSLWNKAEAPWSVEWSVRTSRIQNLPSWARRYRWWGWLMPFLFESFDFSEFNVVISVTGEAAKAIITKPEQLHICYLLTPTRYLWSHQDVAQQSIVRPARGLARWVIQRLQKWDKVLAQRPDEIIPISQLVAQRAQEFYGLQTSEPIYPPFTEFPEAVEPNFVPKQVFFFTWGRHVRYKRFDLAIQAAVEQNVQLVIAGQGPETATLQKLARKLDPYGKYVEFVGQISDAELHWYLQHAEGAIFPQIEDFGIVIGEALLAGCPVIAQRTSGVVELLSPNHGILIDEESFHAVAAALAKFRNHKWSRTEIRKQAQHHSGEAFIAQWRQHVEKAWRSHQRALSSEK